MPGIHGHFPRSLKLNAPLISVAPGLGFVPFTSAIREFEKNRICLHYTFVDFDKTNPEFYTVKFKSFYVDLILRSVKRKPALIRAKNPASKRNDPASERNTKQILSQEI